MMTKEEMNTIFAQIVIAYPSFIVNRISEVNEVKRTWYYYLGKYRYEDVRKKLDRWVVTHHNCPSISDLIPNDNDVMPIIGGD